MEWGCNMHLNIKSEEAHQLASKLSKLTGENMTQAVTNALREKIEQMEKNKRQSSLVRQKIHSKF